MKRWAVGRRGTLMRTIDSWKSVATSNNTKGTVLMNSFVKASRYFEKQKYKWALSLWVEWLASGKSCAESVAGIRNVAKYRNSQMCLVLESKVETRRLRVCSRLCTCRSHI